MRALLLVASMVAAVARAEPPDLTATAGLFASGRYAECIEQTRAAIERGVEFGVWPELKAKSELAIGRWEDAYATCERALANRGHFRNLRLRWLGREAALRCGKPEQAADWLREIRILSSRAPHRFTDAGSLAVIGRAALADGTSPRTVMETFFQPAAKPDAGSPDGFLALGELALAKGDFELAAETFAAAAKAFPDDADVALGLAKSVGEADPEQAERLVRQALERNPSHVPTLLLRLDQAIDAENRAAADALVARVLEVNPHQPQAWAVQAVLHLLDEKPAEAAAARAKAFGAFTKNPEVDHLIGLKLSRKYRFKEAAEHQRQALTLDPGFTPARAQLAQDLLRLGEDAEGWDLVKRAQEEDPYDVSLFNLMQLRDDLDTFTTLENDHFILRMDAREAVVYGHEVLALLERARRELCEKYGLTLERKIVVEMYPQASDFAVRTFGMPGGGGILGVCFGKVITLKSPAAYGGGEGGKNWRSVLWHEFCHTVTLEATRNRMPRWLSEGISVHEERAADPTWGQRMNAENREWILAGKLAPIAEMSGAFLHPPSPRHLMAAYFQASLVVDFLVERFGHDALQAVLRDLSAGVPVDKAFAAHAVSDAELERQFREFAEKQARGYGPGLDWTKHDLTTTLEAGPAALEQWLAAHPTSYQGLSVAADEAIQRKEFATAKRHLEKLIELLPAQQGDRCAYERLAAVHRQLGETAEERAVLERYARHAEAATEAHLRLMQLDLAAGDWPAAERIAEKLISTAPMSPTVHEALAECAEHRHDEAAAARAYRALLHLDPEHATDTHLRLARCLHRSGDGQAKQHVLLALEAAPRSREAQRLLLEIVRQERATPGKATP